MQQMQTGDSLKSSTPLFPCVVKKKRMGCVSLDYLTYIPPNAFIVGL